MNFVMKNHNVQWGNASARIERALTYCASLEITRSLALLCFVRGVKRINTLLVSQERLGPSYFFISLVLVPLNSLVWYVHSSRYTRGLGWRIHCGVEVTESSTNKQHIIDYHSPNNTLSLTKIGDFSPLTIYLH
jgi:hypothetical protein